MADDSTTGMVVVVVVDKNTYGNEKVRRCVMLNGLKSNQIESNQRILLQWFKCWGETKLSTTGARSVLSDFAGPEKKPCTVATIDCPCQVWKWPSSIPPKRHRRLQRHDTRLHIGKRLRCTTLPSRKLPPFMHHQALFTDEKNEPGFFVSH